ncbi:MAG: hypothetical protein NXH75_18110 [Halobacteriovoraceae bacterium]|nr:hypothetical protein [Halobacteriovoraceae bacterium]
MKHLYQSFILISLLFSCSRLDPKTQVVGEAPTNLANMMKKKEERDIKESLLTNRQSLRIALLKLEIDGVSSKKILIFADELLPFGDIQTETVEKVFSLHREIFPEYYRLLDVVERKSIPLIFICQKEWKCSVIKKGLSISNRSRAQFLRNSKRLKKVDRKTLRFSLGGRKFRNKNSNAMWQYPLFDLRFPKSLEEISIQSWLNLKEFSNK